MTPESAAKTMSTPIGPLWVEVSQVGLRRVTFAAGQSWSGPKAANVLLADVENQLSDYFRRQRLAFDFPLDWGLSQGWAKQVRMALFGNVEYGRTVSYGELAVMAQSPGSARAVGGVMASNPIPVVVPCHRVIAADGAIGGFAGSGGAEVATKRRLLTMEGALPPTLFDV